MSTNAELIADLQSNIVGDPFPLMRKAADAIEALGAEVGRLKGLAVMEFNEDEVPSFTQGYHPHELTTAVTADRCSVLVKMITDLRAQLAAAQGQVEEQRKYKDSAYLERNRLVALLSKVFPSGKKKTAIEGWSEDWHGCVYIDLPTGQASWHYHDSQAWLFEHLTEYQGTWDGHTTDEKYERIQGYATPIPQQVAVPAECCEHCDDGDGLCVFPMYGPAPHTHDTSSGWIGSTRTLPKEQWGNNFREDPDCKGHGVYMRCESCGRGEQQATAPSVPEGWKQAVALAYGHLWHVNNEPMAPIPLRSSETAAYEARKQLRDLLTHEERGLAINQVQALLAAAPQPKETK